MGVTPRMWSALDKFSSKRTLYNRVGWDHVNKQVEFHPISIKLIPYLIATLVLLPIVTFCCGAILTLQLFGFLNLDSLPVLTTGAITLLAITGWFVEAMYLFSGKDLVHFANSLIRLDPKLRSGELLQSFVSCA